MVTIPFIKETVVNYFNIPNGSIDLKTRSGEIKESRQIAHYLARKLTTHSLKEIGYQIGQLDHATVLHSYKTVQNFVNIEKDFRLNVCEIERILLAPETQIEQNKLKIIQLTKEIYGEDCEQLTLIRSIFCCD